MIESNSTKDESMTMKMKSKGILDWVNNTPNVDPLESQLQLNSYIGYVLSTLVLVMLNNTTILFIVWLH